MRLEEIKADLKIRIDKAKETYKQEMQLESPCIRTKESSWGKLVAYSHALKLLNNIKG